ncbi:MAG: molybdopterin-dependent oxidoreductase [Candidatus Dormiibacterota bacterium]
MERRVWRGIVAGAVAAIAALAAMEIVAAVLGTVTIPDLLQAPLLAHLPGPVFGFLIDRLQHWGKVTEEIGLLLLLVVVLAALGGAAGALASRVPASGLVAALVAWLVLDGAILPLAGAGVLGAGHGLLEAATTTLPFAVYGLLLQGLLAPRPGTGLDAGRRRALGLGAGLLGLFVIGVTRVPAWAQSLTTGGSGRGALVPALTPASQFYIVSKNFTDPDVAAAGWRLRLSGLVGKPLTLTLPELRALPSVTETLTQECISNQVGGDQISTGHFTGVRLRDLLARVAPQADATTLGFSASDGYTESMQLAAAQSDERVLVAYLLDGAPLPTEHGFPARLLVPAHYGMRGPKWLTGITVGRSAPGGYWEQQGWDPSAPVQTTSRFDAPLDGAVLPIGAVLVGGIAFAADRGIQSVEWSTDGGTTWRPATLEAPLSPLTWVRWQATWHPPRAGSYRLAVRARDGKGTLQTSAVANSFPSGATGLHEIDISIGSSTSG